MKPKTYIETSIPSFYHEIRNEPDMIARRQWTRQWWEECRPHYEIFTSDAVLDELRRGHYPIRDVSLGESNSAATTGRVHFRNCRSVPAT